MQQSKVKIIRQQIKILFIRTSPIKVVYSKHCNRRRQTPFLVSFDHSAPDRERSIVMTVSVCLSVCLPIRDHIFGTTRPIFTRFFCACYLRLWHGFFLGGVATRYVLPVIRMPPYDVTQAKAARRRRPAEAQTTCSLGLGYKGRAMVAVVGLRTHVQTTVFI